MFAMHRRVEINVCHSECTTRKQTSAELSANSWVMVNLKDMASLKAMGNLSKDTGNLSKGMGNLSKGTGSLSKAMGNLSKDMGNLSKGMGSLSKVTDNHKVIGLNRHK
ncbi:unnamed protein product [Phyllotreta striolata]|uniref:Uncharacterized protein n=1 Tax=Phyllotreta striolata TaxID=444603 RepID=A0A9N9XQJ9_PHYSR|nr:unnamed protein product [Phyllotreta striolata]